MRGKGSWGFGPQWAFNKPMMLIVQKGMQKWALQWWCQGVKQCQSSPVMCQARDLMLGQKRVSVGRNGYFQSHPQKLRMCQGIWFRISALKKRVQPNQAKKSEGGRTKAQKRSGTKHITWKPTLRDCWHTYKQGKDEVGTGTLGLETQGRGTWLDKHRSKRSNTDCELYSL